MVPTEVDVRSVAKKILAQHPMTAERRVMCQRQFFAKRDIGYGVALCDLLLDALVAARQACALTKPRLAMGAARPLPSAAARSRVVRNPAT